MKSTSFLKNSFPGKGLLSLVVCMILSILSLQESKAQCMPVNNLVITGPAIVYWGCGTTYTYSIQNPTGGACYIWGIGGLAGTIVSGQYSSSVVVKFEICNPNSTCYPGPAQINAVQFNNCNYASCPPRRGEKSIQVNCP